jgi:hypothetical protein
MPCHPLPVSRPYAPLLLQLISLPHLPRQPRAAGPRHHHQSSSECRRPPRNVAVPPHPPPHQCPTPIGEARCHPSCPVTSSHHPCDHATDHATREPPPSPSRPRHRVRCHYAVTTLSTHAHHADWHGPVGPLYRWASGWKVGLVLCGDFPIFNFHLLFQKICINFKNVLKIQCYPEKY